MLTSWYPDAEQPHSGIFIRHQAQALSEGHEVTVLAIRMRQAFNPLKIEKISSVNGKLREVILIIYRSFPLYNQVHLLAISFLNAWMLCRKTKPEVLHVSIGYPSALLGYMLSKIFRIPYLVSEHTLITNNFRSAFHKWATILGYRKANAILAVSNYLKKGILTYVDREVTVIPNFIPVESTQLKRGPTGDKIMMGILANMNTPVKGIDVLIRALKIVKAAGIHFQCEVGGEGQLRSTYQQQSIDSDLQTEIKFHGYIDPNVRMEFIQQCHLFVCSSRSETFNVSLLEAMGLGLPIVSTKCGGPEDFVTSETGILCENNAEALAHALIEITTRLGNYDPEVIRNYVLSNYTEYAYLRRMNLLLAQLTAA